MRRRQKAGDRNIVGMEICRIRREKKLGQAELLSRIQLQGIDMNQAKLSRIEGQMVAVTDRDLYAISQALGISIRYALSKFCKGINRGIRLIAKSCSL